MKKVLSIIGTRPNFIKMAPVCRAFNAYSGQIKHILCHTGQHSDDKMSGIFFSDLGMPDPDYHLGISSGTHAEQTGRIMKAFEDVLITEQPDLVIVVGDVNSTMACALATVKLHIPVAHIESGLRSGDRTMPEEINRIITDAISDLMFVTEQSGLDNLSREGVPDYKVFFTGNVMIDSLVHLEKKILSSEITRTLKLTKGNYFLVTFHRPSNVDHQKPLEELIGFLNEIAALKEVIFPVHPRTLKNIREFGLESSVSSRIQLIAPLGYLDFQSLIRDAFMVITDSGGIQEETTFLGIPCATFRDNTERPVTVTTGTNFLCGTDLREVRQVIDGILEGNLKKGAIPELWDGHASERIVNIIAEYLG